MRRLTACLFLSVTFQIVGLQPCSAQNEAPPKEAAAADTIGPKEDTSLANDAYIEAGVPAYDRQWLGQDYAKAVDKLAELDQGEVCKLPRFGSALSGKVFSRLCSVEDSDNMVDKKLALEIRVPDGIKRMLAASKLLQLYVTRQSRKQVSDRDVVEITGAVVNVMARFARVVNEIPKLDPADPNFARQKTGRDQFESGNSQTLAGLLQMLGETEVHGLTARKRLLQLCAEPFVALYSNATPAGRKELAIRLREMVKDDKFATLQPQLGQLEAKVAKLFLAEQQNPAK